MVIEILHNSRCRKSREALQFLQEKDTELVVVDYMKEPLSIERLTSIIQKLGIKPVELLRKKEAVFKEKFKGKELSDEEWIAAMVEFPKLMERPIVIANGKAVVARPVDKIEEIV